MQHHHNDLEGNLFVPQTGQSSESPKNVKEINDEDYYGIQENLIERCFNEQKSHSGDEQGERELNDVYMLSWVISHSKLLRILINGHDRAYDSTKDTDYARKMRELYFDNPELFYAELQKIFQVQRELMQRMIVSTEGEAVDANTPYVVSDGDAESWVEKHADAFSAYIATHGDALDGSEESYTRMMTELQNKIH